MNLALTFILLFAPLALAAQAQDSVTLPLADHLQDGKRIGYWLPVAVADGRPGMVLLDTGSCGLMIMPGYIGPGVVRKTGKRMNQTFVDGSVFIGEIVLARIRIGPVDTPGPVPVLAVDQVECTKGMSDCPGKHFLNSPLAGVIGVGIGTALPLENPLRYVPAPLSSGFIVQGSGKSRSPSLTLGITAQERQTFSYSPLPKRASPRGSASAFFDQNAFPAYLSIEGSAVSNLFGMVLFDSGGSLSVLHLPANLKPNDLRPDGFLPQQKAVGFSMPGLPEYHTTTGDAPWSDRFKIVLDNQGRNILGAGFFKHFDLLYDLQRQVIGIRPAR